MSRWVPGCRVFLKPSPSLSPPAEPRRPKENPPVCPPQSFRSHPWALPLPGTVQDGPQRAQLNDFMCPLKDELFEPPSQELIDALPGIKSLTSTQWVALQITTPRDNLPEVPGKIIDVSQTPGRTVARCNRSADGTIPGGNAESDADGDPAYERDKDGEEGDDKANFPICGCFTPAGVHFHTGRCRPLLGEEGLRCLGHSASA